MKARIGVDAVVDDIYLESFPSDVQIVRIAEEPEGEIEVDFWIPGLPFNLAQRQWPHLKGVKVVQVPWAGVDAWLKFVPPGVTLCDARGVHDIPTAEWAVTAILAMQKYLPFFLRRQWQGAWAVGQQSQIGTRTQIKNPPAPIKDVADSTVLIVGYGSIGKAMEARLAPFAAKFLRVARRARDGVYPVAKLDELLGKADIVVLITPLTSETRHLMNAARLAKMQPGALLVNASRGAIVDTEALLQALNENRIRAAVDVTDPEPLPEGHPLWKAPNLLVTPHIAGESEQFAHRAFELVRAQIQRFVRGEPLLNIVTGEY